MTVGSLEGRLVLSGVAVVTMFVLEVVIPGVRAAIERQGAKKHGHHHHHHHHHGAADPMTAASAVSTAAAMAKADTHGSRHVRPSERPSAAETGDPIRDEAARLWREASGIAHPHLPSWENDEPYLKLVLAAARLGHSGAMSKLGDYAFCRKIFDEAFYWKMKVKIKGVPISGVRLRDVLKIWKKTGCPRHVHSYTSDFGEAEAEYARAALKLMNGLDGHRAREKIRDLSAEGNRDATDFMHWHDGYRKAQKDRKMKGAGRGGGKSANLSRIWKSYGNRRRGK